MTPSRRTNVLAAVLAVIALFPAAAELRVQSGSKVIADGGTWNIPMNSVGSKVALFSEQREPFSLRNDGGSALRVSSIEVEPAGGVMAEEFSLQNTELVPGPLDFSPTEVAAGGSFDFYVRFYPVQSGERTATVTVTCGGGERTSFQVTGRGRDDARFTGAFSTAATRLFGGRETDEMVTGMAADAQGNVYFAGQVTGVEDKFAYDLFYGKISADGALAWAKLWNGPFRDYSRDPGQNDETGGAAGAIDVDEQGYVYLTGSVSPSRYNNNFAALVLKADPATGEIVWEKLWRPDWPSSLLAKHSAEAYALDVAGDRVYVVGTTGAAEESSDALAFVLGLSAGDGTLQFQRYFDPTPKSNDRAYAVRADGRGNLYVGGLAAKVSLLAKLTGAESGAPEVAWVKTLETGWGSNLGCLDLDEAGNVYASVDRRGATTAFSFLKLDPDGNLLWGRTYTGGNNKNNNCSFVYVDGGDLYVGGRTGQSWYDAQMGDGKLLKVRAEDGSPVWSVFYYTGKGPDELAEHRVRGIAVRGGRIYSVGQVYTGNKNGVRYWGYWYEGVSGLEPYTPDVEDLGLGPGSGKPMPDGAVRDASGARKLLDLGGRLEWQEAAGKTDGDPPDGELIYWRLEAK